MDGNFVTFTKAISIIVFGTQNKKVNYNPGDENRSSETNRQNQYNQLKSID